MNTDGTGRPLLVVVTGATASGKTELAIGLAERLGCDIVSADSRQIYRGMSIGTAAPTAAEQARVRHHLVQCLDPTEYYSAALFEEDALRLLGEQWSRTPVAVVCGGSMMYIDALTDGIDELPSISPEVRTRVLGLLEQHGSEGLLALLDNLDPEYAARVDRANTRRVAHAVEITLQSGVPYSALRRGRRVRRPFDILKVAIARPREELFARINARVDRMMETGLEAEARALMSLRGCNALNTVGYKEIYAYLDGAMSRDEAVARIAKNTRVYAKKQLTWLARPSVRPTVWLSAEDALAQAMQLVEKHKNNPAGT